MRKVIGMKMKAALFGSLMIMMLTVGLVSVQAAAGGNGKGNGGSGGGNSGEVRGSHNNPTDPCLDVSSPCGQGDHGQGDPVNGSLHANCNAAQGEVDPVCVTETPTEDPPSS